MNRQLQTRFGRLCNYTTVIPPTGARHTCVRRCYPVDRRHLRAGGPACRADKTPAEVSGTGRQRGRTEEGALKRAGCGYINMVPNYGKGDEEGPRPVGALHHASLLQEERERESTPSTPPTKNRIG
jgi:hypothetical protein